MSNWKEYKNGNTIIRINAADGTREMFTKDDDFDLEFPISADVCITKKCDGGCQYCYEGCTTEGQHGKLDYEFLNHLHPYTELAINGNDLSHPDLLEFLARLKEQKVFVNMTVNQIHFDRHKDFIDQLLEEGLIKGLGISVVNPTVEFVNKIKPYENVVLHVINGIFSPAQYEVLKDNDLKVLILGYKDMRRGEEYLISHISDVQNKMNWMYDNIDDITKHFKVTCFDNLALEQLNIRRLLSDEEWEVFYNGSDGKISMYIDLVSGTFSKNSVAPLDRRYPIDDFCMDEMFDIIKMEGRGYEIN